MPDEIEVPIEHVQHEIEHAAHEGHGGGGHEHGGGNWITWSALLSAVLAVLAAVGALQAGHHVNEAMLDQIHASDTWAYYQAKSIKSSVLDTRAQILEAMGKPIPASIGEKQAQYKEDQEQLTEKAKEKESASEAHFQRHQVFATAVTFFQIAIAVTAIAVLAKRRRFLFVSGAFGLIGICYLIQGFFFSGGGGGH